MTRFLDGPAAGEVLMLKRAPVFLRVVRNSAGAWDALDIPSDTPSADETIHVYRREGRPGWIHVNRSKKAGGHFTGTTASYRLIDPQPHDLTLRDRAQWEAWARGAWDRVLEDRKWKVGK